MYSNIKVYQIYLATSIKVGCATRSLYASSGPKAEGVPTNNQRGRGSGPCRLWGGLDKARHIVPTALLVRVQRFKNDLYKAVKGGQVKNQKCNSRHINYICLTNMSYFYWVFDLTQVLLCLFPGVLWLWYFLYSVGPHPVSSFYIYTFVVSRTFMAGAASQAGDADSSRAPGLTSGLQGSVNVHRGALLLISQWQCISSLVFYILVMQNSWQW